MAVSIKEEKGPSFVEQLILQRVDVNTLSQPERELLTGLLYLSELVRDKKPEEIDKEEWKKYMENIIGNISRMDHQFQSQLLEKLPPWMFMVCAENPSRFRGLKIIIIETLMASRKEGRRIKILGERERVHKEVTQMLMKMKSEEIQAAAATAYYNALAQTGQKRGFYVPKWGAKGGKKDVDIESEN